MYFKYKKGLETIGFGSDDTNMMTDWKITKGNPKLVEGRDDYFGKVLNISSDEEHEVMRNISPAAGKAKKIEYIAHPEISHPNKDFVFYLHVEVKDTKGIVDEKWITLVMHNIEPNFYSKDECRYPASPYNLGRGWIRFNTDIRKAVKKTFGKDKLEFNHLTDIKIRGNVSLVSIRIY